MHQAPLPDTDASPFELPLTPDQFRRAVEVGHGRAWLHLAQHGAEGMHRILLHALPHETAYEPLLEPGRAEWIMGLVDTAGAGATLYSRFLRRVHDTAENDDACSHWKHRAQVLAELAERGMPGARAALDRVFVDCRTKHPESLVGASCIVYLDDERGLVQVCSFLGNEAHAKGADAVIDWHLSYFDEDDGEGAALRVLEAAREDDPGVARFLAIRDRMQERFRIEETDLAPVNPLRSPRGPTDESWPRRLTDLTAEHVIDWVRNTPAGPPEPSPEWKHARPLWRWACGADQGALQRVRAAFDTADSELEQLRCIRILAGRNVLQSSERLFQLAESPNVALRDAAWEELGRHTHPRIRSLALRHLTPEGIRSGSLALLEQNSQPGDHIAIERALLLPEDDHIAHHAVISPLVRICERLAHADCLRLMLVIYERSPCGFCRKRVAEMMLDLEISPAWLEEECRFDAMHAIRTRFGG